jgi:hypothetical protein
MTPLPFQPAPNCIHFAIIGELAGQLIVNHIDYDLGEAVTASNIANVADQVATIWDGAICPHLSQDYTFDHVHAVDLTDAVGFVADTGLAGTSGGVASPTEANNAAIVITYRTALRGRSFRGRTYLAGIPQSKRVSGIAVDETWVTSLITSFEDFTHFTGFVDSHPVVLSRTMAGVRLTTCEITPIVAFTANNIIDAQRRRLGGRGA